MTFDVQVNILRQGAAICGQGYMLKLGENVAAFYIDGWGKTGRIYCSSTCDSIYVDKKILKYPSMWIDEGDDNSDYTEIYFPEYEGWRVHCTGGGKSMAVCLVKS